jgi:hypothetical protein
LPPGRASTFLLSAFLLQAAFSIDTSSREYPEIGITTLSPLAEIRGRGRRKRCQLVTTIADDRQRRLTVKCGIPNMVSAWYIIFNINYLYLDLKIPAFL